MKNIHIWSGIAALLISALACNPQAAFSDSSSTPTVAPTAPQAPAEASADVPKSGEAGQQLGYSLTATNVEDPATPGLLYTATPNTRLVAVDVILANVSGKTVSSNSLDFLLEDSNGFLYPYTSGGVDLDKEIPLNDLHAGDKAQGLVAFVVPSDAVLRSIHFLTYLSEEESNLSLRADLTTQITPLEPSAALPILGQPDKRYALNLIATEVVDPATPWGEYKPAANTRLVAVNVTLNNTGGSKYVNLIENLYFILQDTDGNLYQPNQSTIRPDGRFDFTDYLGGGQNAKGLVAFEVHTEAVLRSILYPISVVDLLTQQKSTDYLQTGLAK